LSDPVRTGLAFKAASLGLAAGAAAGFLALLFAPKVEAAEGQAQASRWGILCPTALVAGAAILTTLNASSLDPKGMLVAQETTREDSFAERKLAVVCMDAAMWRLVDRYIGEGRMPVTEGLMKVGVRGNLMTWGQRLSPVVWTSMVTGMSEKNHGIHGFTEIVGDSLTPSLTRSTSRSAASLWNVTQATGTKTLVLNWLVTDPPETVPGLVIPNLKSTLAGIAPATYPPALREALQGIVDQRDERKAGPESGHSGDVVADEMELLSTLQAVYDMASSIDDYSLVVTGTQTTDGVMHQRMLHAFPEDYDLEQWGTTPAELEAGAEDLALAYGEADRFLGQLVDDGYTILLVSDHGSRAQGQPMVTFSLNALLADMGLAIQSEPEAGQRRRVDKEKSRAFEAGNNALSSEVGIFFQDSVTEGVSTAPLRDLLGDLRNLHIEGEDALLFEGVVDLARRPVFPVLRDQGAAAAVVLGSALRSLPGDRRVVVAGESRPLSRYSQVQSGINGTHEPHGLFLLAGPHVAARGSIDSLCVETSVAALLSWVIGSKPIATPLWRSARRLGLVSPYTTLDIAPTALTFLGLPTAADMDGGIMEAALAGEPHGRFGVRSHSGLLQDGGVEGEVDEEADAAVMDLLRDLGYVR
ncbi:MAG: putative AlkP superfamily phosphohydrolase/phosphomutase, partial [Gammaproteobacteria bacterium]